jgi:outer membrane protein assembly factor BamB
MRRLAGLFLVAVPGAFAAPQKDQLPPGAVGRLGNPVAPARDMVRPGEVNSLTFLDDKTLFVGTNAGWRTWDLEKRQSKQPRPVGGPTFVVAHAPQGLFVGSAQKLHSIEPPESATAEPARSWDSASDAVAVLAVAPRGSRVVFSNGDQKLSVLDPKTGKVTGTAELASRPVAASLTANGRILAVVTRDGAARVYGLSASGMLDPLWTKRVARSDRVAAAFSPDGRLFAVSSAGRVMLLDAVTGRLLHNLERSFGEGDVRCLAFSPDGRQVAVGSGGPDPVVRVSDVIRGSGYGTFTGHTGDVNALAFSPDGRTLASAGSDASVLLWKVPVPGGGTGTTRVMTADEAWDTLDALEADVAYRIMGHLLAHPGRATEVIGAGFRGMADEEKRIRRWITELDHDEFRVREAARRSLLKTGLRGAPALTDPARKRLGAEGEQRVRLILEAMEAQGLRIPEGGLFGEPLRTVRAVRVLETIGGKDARAVLEQAARGPADARLTKEAKAALETLPER